MAWGRKHSKKSKSRGFGSRRSGGSGFFDAIGDFFEGIFDIFN